MCLDIDIAAATLKLGLYSECKSMLESIYDALPKSGSAETLVYSKYYGTCAELRKVSIYVIYVIKYIFA